MKSNEVSQVLQLINKDLQLEDNTIPATIGTLEDLELKLTYIISHLLDRDMSRLMNVLYRIDVSERRIKEVLAFENPERISPAIAQLIIERLLQKVQSKNSYRSS